MSRRGKREGSIYQDADGRWIAAVTVGYYRGRRLRRRVVGATREQVSQRLTDLLHEHQHGGNIAPDDQTVGQFLTSWLKDCAKNTVRPSTFRSYAGLINGHLIPGLGMYRLKALHAQQYNASSPRNWRTGAASRTQRARAPSRVCRAAVCTTC